MKTAENSTAYSINNTARQVLWLPTTAEMKYKAKPAIETFFVRLGDGVAAVTVMIAVQFHALAIRSALILNVTLVVLWLVAARVVIRGHRRLATRADHSTVAAQG
jgi:AAA family ATP:ADP antiporter